MPRVKKLEVQMRDLKAEAGNLLDQGFNNLRIQFPKQNPDIPWSLHKAQVRAWRSVKTRPAKGTGPGWKGESLEDKK